MNLIERVARASHDFFRPIYKLPPWEEIPPDAHSMALQNAKAILVAIRDPTASMVSAAFEGTAFQSARFNEIEDGWKHMIDAAVRGQ